MKTPLRTDDRDLLLLLEQGDVTAYERLYRRYSRPIFRRLLRLTQSEWVAEELLQQVAIILWEKRHLIDAQLPLQNWLYVVARNLVAQHYKSIQRRDELYDKAHVGYLESHLDIEDDLFAKELRAELDKVLDQLPEQGRTIFVLCRLEGRSYEEVADMIGLSQTVVRGQLYRATQFVRKQMRIHQALLVLSLSVLAVR